ncbi:hypothetical protein ACFL13_02170 [Patescibacteria group bacterium]
MDHLLKNCFEISALYSTRPVPSPWLEDTDIYVVEGYKRSEGLLLHKNTKRLREGTVIVVVHDGYDPEADKAIQVKNVDEAVEKIKETLKL